MNTAGILILVFLVIFVIFGLALGVFCHFCGEANAGGHYYGSNENIAPKIIFLKEVKSPATNKPKSRCRCSNKFKGYCKNCEGESFVDDGADRRGPDFSDFGGDKGLDPGWNNKSDPIRSSLGTSSGDTGGVSGSGGGDSSNAYVDSALNATISDQQY